MSAQKIGSLILNILSLFEIPVTSYPNKDVYD